MYQIDQKHELRESFLKAFVSTLIKANLKPEKKEQTKKKDSLQDIKHIPEGKGEMKPSLRPTQDPALPMPKVSVIRRPGAPRRPPKFAPPIRKSRKPTPSEAELPPLPPQQPKTLIQVGGLRPDKPTLPEELTASNQMNLGKVTQLLLDPSVISVECPGPAKNVLVNKAGKIQATPIQLTQDEIDNIIKEVSDKTRVPLVPSGLFKAAFQDLIMTAIVSELAGTRFVIQKRTPFRPY